MRACAHACLCACLHVCVLWFWHGCLVCFSLAHPLAICSLSARVRPRPSALLQTRCAWLRPPRLQVFCASDSRAHEEMRQACFDYLALGGIYSCECGGSVPTRVQPGCRQCRRMHQAGQCSGSWSHERPCRQQCTAPRWTAAVLHGWEAVLGLPAWLCPIETLSLCTAHHRQPPLPLPPCLPAPCSRPSVAAVGAEPPPLGAGHPLLHGRALWGGKVRTHVPWARQLARLLPHIGCACDLQGGWPSLPASGCLLMRRHVRAPAWLAGAHACCYMLACSPTNCWRKRVRGALPGGLCPDSCTNARLLPPGPQAALPAAHPARRVAWRAAALLGCLHHPAHHLEG